MNELDTELSALLDEARDLLANGAVHAGVLHRALVNPFAGHPYSGMRFCPGCRLVEVVNRAKELTALRDHPDAVRASRTADAHRFARETEAVERKQALLKEHKDRRALEDAAWDEERGKNE